MLVQVSPPASSPPLGVRQDRSAFDQQHDAERQRRLVEPLSGPAKAIQILQTASATNAL
jgi:hypothetical protein